MNQIKVRLYNLLFRAKRGQVSWYMDEDPETGRRWYQKPRSREGDIWMAKDNEAYKREGGEWIRVRNE
jgi:hypothetical protein